MKKRILAASLAAVMSLSTLAFADGEITEVEKISEENEAIELVAPVELPLFVTDELVCIEVNDENAIIAKDELGPDFIITTNEKTLIFNSKGEVKTLSDIKKDTSFVAYDYATSPRVLMYPETYTARIIIINEENSMAFADTFKKSETLGQFVNTQNTLALNIADETIVVDEKGEKVEDKDFDNKDLLVFYSMATFSIPAQTTPEKIVVLEKNEENVQVEIEEEVEDEVKEDIKVEKVVANSKEITGEVIYEGELLLLPFRAIIEAYDFNVEWNDEDKAVIYGPGYSIKVGENSYILGRMMPIELEVAPKIINDRTYVPASYFEKVLGKKLTNTNGVLTIEENVIEEVTIEE